MSENQTPGKQTKCIILAAGQGTRMRPLTDNCPKGLLSLEGETIVGRQIRILKELGIPEQNIAIVVGYKAEKYRDKYEETEIQLIENKNFSETDNLYSFLLSKKFYTENDLLVLNGDVVFQKELMNEVLDTEGSAYPVDTHPDDDAIKVNTSNGSIAEILGKNAEYYHGCTIGIFKIGEKDVEKIYREAENLSSENKNQWFESSIAEAVSETEFTAVDITKYYWDELDNPEEFVKGKVAVNKLEERIS